MSEQTNEGSGPNERSADSGPGLRVRAEQHLRTLSYDPPTPEVSEQLIHELRVHQIELELQNEELHRAQDELASSCMRATSISTISPRWAISR
jgi:hypothetical protein